MYKFDVIIQDTIQIFYIRLTFTSKKNQIYSQ